MDKDTALNLALDALDELLYWDNGKPEYDKAREAITAIKQARSAPVQEPVAWVEPEFWSYLERSNCGTAYRLPDGERQPLYTTPPAAVVNQQLTTEPATPLQEPPPECQTEAEKRAYAFGWWKALEANRVAPVHEPSRTQTKQIVDGLQRCHHPDSQHEFLRTWVRDWTIHKTAQRQWVGLTDEEITALKRNGERYISSQDFARAIEAKLRSKNNG